MLKTLRSLFGATAAPGTTSAAREATVFADVDMHWYDDTRLPLPVWENIAEAERPEWTVQEHDAFWTAAAGHWLQAMAAALPVIVFAEALPVPSMADVPSSVRFSTLAPSV